MITGYRRYQINGDMLRGAHDDWEGRELQATCYGSAETCEQHLTGDEVFGPRCSCGIYVLKGPDMIQDYAKWPAIAAVTAWGAYIEFEYGYRIQYTRIEHVWIEPDWVLDSHKDDVDWEPQLDLDALAQRYGVVVEFRQSAVCCGQQHKMAYWPSKQGPISVCKMETSHIVNAMKYIKTAARRDSHAQAWKFIFEQELDRRKARVVGGKMKVVF